MKNKMLMSVNSHSCKKRMISPLLRLTKGVGVFLLDTRSQGPQKYYTLAFFIFFYTIKADIKGMLDGVREETCTFCGARFFVVGKADLIQCSTCESPRNWNAITKMTNEELERMIRSTKVYGRPDGYENH